MVDAPVWNQQQVEDFLRPYGFTGNATNGAAAQFLQNNPTANTAFNSAVKNYTAATNGQNQSFVPLTVEPLNTTQKTGLLGLSTPVDKLPGTSAMQSVLQQLQSMQGQNTINPAANAALQDASSYTRAGAAPLTQSEVQGLSNPFASGLNDQITQAGKVARAAILANQGLRGGAAFGNTSQGNELGLLDQGIMNATNTNNYNTFQSALNAILTQRGNNLQAGNVANNTAQTAQGVTNSGNSNALQQLQALFNAGTGVNNNLINTSTNQINAGNQIQGQNQKVADAIAGNIQGGINYPISNLTNIMNLLKSFESGTAGAVAPANSLTQLGAGLSGASGILGQLLGNNNQAVTGANSAGQAANNGAYGAGQLASINF